MPLSFLHSLLFPSFLTRNVLISFGMPSFGLITTPPLPSLHEYKEAFFSVLLDLLSRQFNALSTSIVCNKTTC
ncbi:hypothetical protein B0T26DRAFT_385605 [Lasiosphaeria miniovina]|uniref:Secreted protein n=1 Tax=Lasiosphaeria miniovina TaxID=1954250 RepID=A0AA40DSR1_9PEZI|nr:uncharacterized protein B0T26DRAFT_385605 [Lasiosphaeria miniovina]KAK0714125.1 hypothetical protein B0T26DRAFT_385605 [Lasiosphaeria miniovina]